MQVFLEKYVLPILVTITVLVLITNPMRFAALTRIIIGVVLLILALLVSLYLHRRAKNKECSAKAASGPGSPAAMSSFTTPTPRDIYDRIRKLPLYEQEHEAQSYVGLAVHWPVKFDLMFKEKEDPDLYKVVLFHLNDSGPIFCPPKARS